MSDTKFQQQVLQILSVMQQDISELKEDVIVLRKDVDCLAQNLHRVEGKVDSLDQHVQKQDVLIENYMRKHTDILLDGANMYTDKELNQHVLTLHR